MVTSSAIACTDLREGIALECYKRARKETTPTMAMVATAAAIPYLPARTFTRRKSALRFANTSRVPILENSHRALFLRETPFVMQWRGSRAPDAVKSETVEGEVESVVGGGNRNGDGGNGGNGGNGGGGEALGWISSALVFAFYGALIYYAAAIAPAQTPYRDQYFIEKLVGLRSNDGFVINTILRCEFYIMGLWPVVYSSLLLPSARNQKSGPPAWPFLILSFGVGAFALLPYFGLWQLPPPKVTKAELSKFPLNLLENKLVAYGALLSGLGLLITAGLAGEAQWTEMFQYVRESKFIHVMSVDFLTLSTLAPFWVYNDMATRRWLDIGSWLLPLSLVPYLGPALYLVLRPPLPLSMVADEPSET